MSTFSEVSVSETKMSRFPVQAISEWAEKTPTKLALLATERSLTYTDLDVRTDAIANGLAAAGIGAGAVVAYLGKNSIEFYEAWFGANKVGAALSPLNFRSAVPELAEFLADSRPRLVVAAEEYRALVERAGTDARVEFQLLTFAPGNTDSEWERWIASSPSGPIERTISDDEISLLSYTSGTTGVPKGVRWTQAAFENALQWTTAEPSMRWAATDVALMVMPNFHLAGSWVSLPALSYGATIAILPALDPIAVLKAILEWDVTAVCLVPTAITMLLNDPRTANADFGALRTIYYAGSPIPTETIERARAVFGCNLVQFYGTSETYMISILRPEQHDSSLGRITTSAGAALPDVDVRAVAPDGTPLNVEQVGELQVRSTVMFAGYLNKDDLTAIAMDGQWYRTGDLGFLDEEGNVYVIDRVKDMIVSGGENVYSVEVERALSSHPAVAAAAVIGAPDEKWGERVEAYVTLKPGEVVTEEQLRAHCRTRIAGYKVPKAVHIESSLPMTASGKIQKVELREAARRSAS